MHFASASSPKLDLAIKAIGNGHQFYYDPENKYATLSPQDSSPDSSSHHSDSDDDDSPPRSLSSSPVPPISESPPRKTHRILAEGNFTVEEFRDSDYDGWDSDEEDVIRPHQYEDAESERAASVRSASRTRTEIDPRVLHGIKNLQCETDDEREAWVEKQRAEKRRKRRTLSSVQKRTISQSIGSDTDEEDLKPVTFEGANEIGSSARRLRRRTGERASLIFDDPPPRIDEVDEGPESVEEVVEFQEGEVLEGGDLRELPYWYEQVMDVDSDEGHAK